MPTWVFTLIVLLIGLGLAFYIDRLMARPGSGPAETGGRRERSRWLYFWYAGRFPTKAEQDEDERREKDADGPGK